MAFIRNHMTLVGIILQDCRNIRRMLPKYISTTVRDRAKAELDHHRIALALIRKNRGE